MTENNILNTIQLSIANLEKNIINMEKNVSARFDGLEKRFDGFEVRFDGLEVRFDGLEKRFDEFEVRFDDFEDNINDKFILLESRFIKKIGKEIGILTVATAKGFEGQQKYTDKLRSDMMNGFSMIDDRLVSMHEFYLSQNKYHLA